jgi:prepilin-type N-terminal cleavage/methylation domain-containing protein
MESTAVITASPSKCTSRGFTLVEMVVVLAIIAIITVIAVTGQSTFNRTLLLTDTVYSVAFSAREAQSFGLGSRNYGNVTNPGYGLHFSSATPNTYTLFADTSNLLPAPTNPPCPMGTVGRPDEKHGNCRFEAQDGTVSAYTFSRGFKIQRFCGKAGLTRYCSTDAAPLTTLDTVFTRPNTSATISGLVNGVSLTSFTCAEVTISDATGQASTTIRISQLGEVAINQNCP